ncbi:MAG TPA: transcription termination/antitermination NusG family protein [Anaerolineales bacterium]|nr:transcription termination/antitermination NusG family protein [Anaerolineales bacterium]
MAKYWYVLNCKSNKGHIVQQQLQSQGFEVFYPLADSHQGKTGRLQLKPYFPGYLFVRVDLQVFSLSTFQWMPNTEGLVCFGSKPAYVPDTLIQAISRHVREISGNGENPTEQPAYLVHPVKWEVPEDGSGTIFNPSLSSDERVKELLRVLEGMSIPPHLGD